MHRSRSRPGGLPRLAVLMAPLVFVLATLLPITPTSRASASDTASFITVAVVIEVNHHQTIRCVTVRKGASALEILDAMSADLGWPPPTTDAAWPGFICSINGKPSRSTSCLSRFDAKESTWGFWLGQPPNWHYATMGAASTTPKHHDVEAWVLEPGPAVQAKVAEPSVKANFTALCGGQTRITASSSQQGSSHVGGAIAAVGLILGLGSAGVVISRRRRAVP